MTFNEAIKYKTFSEYYINTNDNTVTGQQTPFSINVIMNKDDLSEQVNKDIIPSNYTLASYNKYNKLKERAQTVLMKKQTIHLLTKDTLKLKLMICYTNYKQH